MTFLQPWAVWFLAGMPVIVLLYFLRHKRRTLTVSTHLFWQRALKETSRRALFQRLRHVLSLLLHLLIFALLVGALARPSFERAVPSGTSTVLILDARARMQAREPDGQTRFAKAIALARSYTRQAAEQRQIAILTLDANASVAAPFTGDEKPLVEVLDKVAPADASGNMNDALRLAESLLGSRQGEKRIILLTDRPTDVKTTAPLTTHVVSTPRDNVAITRFATRPLPASPDTSEVLLEVRNFGSLPVKTDVELALDGRAFEVKPFALGPGERRQEIFASLPRSTRNARGWLTARLSTNDALALDNVAYALLPPPRAARVLLVTAGNPFLEKFLAVDNSVKFQLITPETWQPALAPKFEAVIFDGALPVGFDLATAQGNYLFLKATPFPAQAPLEQPLVTEVDGAHPTTRNVSLQNVAILHATALSLPPAHDGWSFVAPLRSFDHALLIAGERKGQRMAALAFDVLESDLPLRIAFPLLMSNTLRWLAGEQPETRPSVEAGDTITLAADERMAAEPLTTPASPLPPATIEKAYQPQRNGYYAIRAGDNTRWLAVNTFSMAESDLRGGGEKTSATVEPAGVLRSFVGWPPWQWLALVALGLFTAEWWFFHRRKTE
jgi:hypothetical protein